MATVSNSRVPSALGGQTKEIVIMGYKNATFLKGKLQLLRIVQTGQAYFMRHGDINSLRT